MIDTEMTTLELLLAHADDHRPVLDGGIPREIAGKAPKPDEKLPAILANRSGDPADLEEQQWGVIAPEGPVGDRLLALIDPLVKARREAQGGQAVEKYRVPARMTAEEVIKWRNDTYNARPAEETPRYLLILGDLDQVSLEMQQYISVDVFMGRLAFSKDEDYEAYVAKVLRWENGPAPEQPPRALFYTARDGTAATSMGYRALMKPTLELARRRRDTGRFPVRELVEMRSDDPDAADLLETVSAPDPALLFSISHGLGPPRRGWKSAEQQRALQGAMSLGLGERIAWEDVKSGRFLPGGVWFFLACYGAGTPSESAYRHWLSLLQRSGQFEGRVDAVLDGLPKPGDRPFIAALPKAALANPDGPLSVIGHIDLAWTYSFQDVAAEAKDRPGRFQEIFRSLGNGGRAGMAHAELVRFLGEAQTDLMIRYNDMAMAEAGGRPLVETAQRVAARANLWMLRQDLLGYIVLGDPAVRIPGAGKARRTAKPVPGEASQPVAPAGQASLSGMFPGMNVTAPKRVPVDDMVAAVKALLAEAKTAKQIAAELGVSKRDVEHWASVYEEAGRAALRALG